MLLVRKVFDIVLGDMKYIFLIINSELSEVGPGFEQKIYDCMNIIQSVHSSHTWDKLDR